MILRFRYFALYALLLSLCPAFTTAQGNSKHDRDNPGQARKQDRDDHDRDGRDRDDRDRDERGLPPGQAKHFEEGRGLPPGQAKKYFHDEDRDRFYTHYRVDVDRWRDRRRPVFIVGRPIETTYIVQPVPRSVWVSVTVPPPPGYQYGYYGGYVVAYNPTTRVVADVLDIVGAATGH